MTFLLHSEGSVAGRCLDSTTGKGENTVLNRGSLNLSRLGVIVYRLHLVLKLLTVYREVHRDLKARTIARTRAFADRPWLSASRCFDLAFRSTTRVEVWACCRSVGSAVAELMG